MGRLTVEPAAKADGQMGEFVEAFARRVEAMPPGQCPVGMMLGQLQASMAQTCGKCTPCAQGMPKIAALLRDVAEFRATEATVGEIRAKATLLRDTADCAVGWQAGQMVLEGSTPLPTSSPATWKRAPAPRARARRCPASRCVRPT